MKISPSFRAQTTTEYLFLSVGVIVFVVLAYGVLNNLSGSTKQNVQSGLADFLKTDEYLLFFDNFDSDTSDQWTSVRGDWRVIDKKFVQNEQSAELEYLTYAGKSGWVNFYAESKISFAQFPEDTTGMIGGIGARVNKVTGGRYVCSIDLVTSTVARIGLHRYFDWTHSELISQSEPFQPDLGNHVIAIQVNGNSVACFYDAVKKTELLNDETPFKYGILSLEQSKAQAHFDVVRAKYQSGPNPSGNPPTPIPTEEASPTATPTDEPTPTEEASPATCSDGTALGECSAINLGKFCGDKSTTLVNSCDTNRCDCAPGFVCDAPSDTCKVQAIPIVSLNCSDGTEINTCKNHAEPIYCDNTQTLVFNCTNCGCQGMDRCDDQSESCTSELGIDYSWVVTNYSITNSSAKINWTTSPKANYSPMEYGRDVLYGSNLTNFKELTAHSVTLSNLDSDMIYHYRINSCSASLGCSYSRDYTFKTLPLGVVISNLFVSSITPISAKINWTTNLEANGSIRFGLTTNYDQKVGVPNSTLYHQFYLNNLDSSTLYHYSVTSCNATQCTSSPDANFTTLAPISCSETDINLDPLTGGNLTNATGNFGDACIGPGLTSMTEYYCSPYYGTVQVVSNCDVCDTAARECVSRYCAPFKSIVDPSVSGVQTEGYVFYDWCSTYKGLGLRYNWYCIGPDASYQWTGGYCNDGQYNEAQKEEDQA